MRKNFNIKTIIFVLITILVIVGVFACRERLFSKKTSPAQYPESQSVSKSTIPDTSSNVIPAQETKPEIPKSVGLKVHFLAQAPNGNWDALHEDACEEASLLMVVHFIKNSSISDGDSEIKNLIAYETQNGYGASITLEDLSKIANSKLGLTAGRIQTNISIDDIKKELVAGKPVIVGASGKALNNPNFRNGGPNYHMLVIKGYDKNGFITNDPGTRKGEGYKYKFDDLFNAIHDWNPENILNGPKNYLVFD